MSEDDIALIMRQPWTMTCTDGGLQPVTEGKPHPRAYGAFPRKLERYVRERGVVELPFAIRSMTALAGRGLRRQGPRRGAGRAPSPTCSSSISPRSQETATYEHPHQIAAGSTPSSSTAASCAPAASSARSCPVACCGSNADADDQQIDHQITDLPITRSDHQIARSRDHPI